jgi:ATP synthase protein I
MFTKVEPVPESVPESRVSDDRNRSERSGLGPEKRSVTGGFSSGVDLISSVVAGLLLGLGLDWWLGTRPVFVIIGIIAGFGSGFYKLWQHSAVLEEQAKERRRGI